MRMAELSRESGVPVATIKYYLREGLLPPGERTSPNQARYDPSHLRRLKLVRALMDVGGLSVAQVGAVLDAIGEHISTHKVLGIVQNSLTLPRTPVDEESRAWAWEELSRVAAERGWKVEEDGPVEQTLISTLCTFVELGRPELVARISDYAEVAARIAEIDLDTVRELPSLELVVEGAVVGTVLGDVLLAGLRRLAQESVSARWFDR